LAKLALGKGTGHELFEYRQGKKNNALDHEEHDEQKCQGRKTFTRTSKEEPANDHKKTHKTGRGFVLN
jgi:hypothetical protein